MTTQEAYEAIREYFSRPDAVLARDEYGDCLYRTPEGNKCAVGCLIPDEVYTPDMEGVGIDSLLDCGERPVRPLCQTLAGVDRHFLSAAQESHDGAEDVESFLADLDWLAQRYGLDVVTDAAP